jgi:fibrillarin-like rRNA methylase
MEIRFLQLQDFNAKLNQLRLDTSKTAKTLHSTALKEVEQEREVEFEVEEVREVQPYITEHMNFLDSILRYLPL